MVNKINLVLGMAIILSIGMLYGETSLPNRQINNQCQYTPSLPDSHFGDINKVYKIHFKKNIPLRLILKYSSNVHSSTFTVYFQSGLFVAGGEAHEEQFDHEKPYCAIKYFTSASFNEKEASQKSHDYKALESLLKAGTSIEFEHEDYFSSELRNGKTIIPGADLYNEARMENYQYILRQSGDREDYFGFRPNWGDGVYALSCSSVYYSSQAETLTVQMVLDALPKGAIVIEERNINTQDCE